MKIGKATATLHGYMATRVANNKANSEEESEIAWQNMHYDAQNDVATQQCSDNTRRDAV
jgi:hypothetical protein